MKRFAIIVFVALASASIATADLYPAVGTDFTWTGPSSATYNFKVEGFVQVDQISGGTTGGPFTLTKLSGPFGTELDNVPQGLRIWCVEDTITFTPGHKYVATIDDVVYSGDLAGDSVALAARAKQVYDGYLGGVIPNGADPLADIRDTIWNAQGLGYSDKIGTDLTGYGGGTFQVLNLWVLAQDDQDNYYATDKQSHIVIPAPGAVLLGGIGLAFLGWTRRRFRRHAD